ncbi:hypothetical protein BaRGS_00029112 [Batillaria attramentaria]|uniref:LAGLIDADG homing endonuclease n=1 Tax=Batillaria attramentaria TaxID=370345 RepID=A0ABD0JX82_9CAEN
MTSVNKPTSTVLNQTGQRRSAASIKCPSLGEVVVGENWRTGWFGGKTQPDFIAFLRPFGARYCSESRGPGRYLLLQIVNEITQGSPSTLAAY